MEAEQIEGTLAIVTGMVILIMHTCITDTGVMVKQVISEGNWNMTLLGFSR